MCRPGGRTYVWTIYDIFYFKEPMALKMLTLISDNIFIFI